MRSDVGGGVRDRGISRAARREQVVRGVLGVGVVRGVHHLPHLLLLLLIHVVRQLRLLVARGGHPLVHVGARHGRRIRGVQTRLKLEQFLEL